MTPPQAPRASGDGTAPAGVSRRTVLRGAAVLGAAGVLGVVGTAHATPRAASFGSTAIHPERLGIYAIPDLPQQWTNWSLTGTSLAALKTILPNVWLRWDNETGHVSDDPASCESFIQQVASAGIPMSITASAVDGYNNWWANGNQQPTTSISDIASGPYLTWAANMLHTYSNVQFIETLNEPDTIFFVSDPDDVSAWSTYLSNLYAATGNDYGHILGPATATTSAGIWNAYLGHDELTNVSYHTYGGWQSLQDVPGRSVYVTEYGDSSVSTDVANSPAYILADLWNAERAGKLSGTIQRVCYVNLQGMMNPGATENGHFAFSGQVRVLAAYQALGAISATAWTDQGTPDAMATDNGAGSFAVLAWNTSETSTESGRTITVPGTSLPDGAALNVLAVLNTTTGSGQSSALSGQGRVGATVSNGTVTLTINSLEPLAAVLVTTAATDGLAT